MLITKVVLAPFGGIGQREIEFHEGLNVVLGDNEAGKSTMVNAIFAVLFIPTDTKKNTQLYRDYLERYFPCYGGDTISVALHFKVNARQYILSRTWGQKRECRLELYDGSVITSEQHAMERLLTLLGFGRGTYEHVFFARQDEMLRTVELLRSGKEAAATLGDVLRAAFIQAGGVSLDELAFAIGDAKKELLSNWDLARHAPNNNRGIDNPYTNNVGQLLAAYYEIERHRRALRMASEAEEKIDEATSKLDKANREKAELMREIELLERIEGDIYQRSRLQPEAEALATKEEQLREINREWPQATERLKNLEGELTALQTRIQKLTEELQESRMAAEKRRMTELFLSVLPVYIELAAVSDSLAEFPHVKKDDLACLHDSAARIMQYEAQLQAARLSAELTVNRPLTVRVQSGMGETRTYTVEESAEFQAEASLLFATDDWSLEVLAGSQDIKTVLTELSSARTALQLYLQQLAVKSISEANRIFETRQQLERKLEQLQARLSGALQSRSYAEVAAAAASQADFPARDPESVLGDLVRAESELKSIREHAGLLRARIANWETVFGTCETLLDRLIDLRSQTQLLQKQLAALAPLPAPFPDSDSFFQHLRTLRARASQLQEMITLVKDELVAAQQQAGDESADEIAHRLSAAQTQFTRLEQKARSLMHVENVFHTIATQIDAQSFAPFEEAFCRYMAPATGHHYSLASLTGVLPSHLITYDGRQLPLELLSTGTARGVALALRLSMAEFLLQKADGFMLMDDPLVDLDPRRKALAAKMIHDFAGNRQMIITTCDPAAAEYLGGSRITLSVTS